MTRRALWVMAVSLMGCGEPSREASEVTMELAWQAPLVSCTARASLAAMSAYLLVGGYQTDCPLAVDAQTLAVTGTCPNIAVGIERPVLLVYSLADPLDEATQVPLALLVGAVDLRPQVVTGRTVDVDLSADGTHALLMVDPADVAALPGAADTDDAAPLFAARQWARARVTERVLSLDCDGDAVGNLVEACEDSLYSDVVPSCRGQ